MPATAPASINWGALLNQIDQGKIIPVIGPGAVVVEGDAGPRPLAAYVAQWTAEYLGVAADADASLHDVACRFLEQRGAKLPRVYDAVWQVMEDHPVEVPDALRKLARIGPLKLFVSTTFDDLLARAVNDERAAGGEPAIERAYEPHNVEDLPAPLAQLTAPIVYHLFGRLSATPYTYAVTEEDTLEFVHALQARDTQPKQLFDELADRRLLVLGGGYADWLARFLLRAAKRDRLLNASTGPVFADVRLRDDASLSAFLQTFSVQADVFAGDAIQFVDELSSRWADYQAKKARPAAGASPNGTPAAGTAAVGAAAAPGPGGQEVFVSYASEDREAVRRVVNALQAAGLPVWFDQRNLEAGDAFADQIVKGIRECPLFLPMLSRRALADADPTGRGRWFRREWKAACDRLDDFYGMDRVFVVPCRIDDVPPNAAGIPPKFCDLHAPAVADDAELAVYVARVRSLYRTYVKASEVVT